jgi:hypothetical protein
LNPGHQPSSGNWRSRLPVQEVVDQQPEVRTRQGVDVINLCFGRKFFGPFFIKKIFGPIKKNFGQIFILDLYTLAPGLPDCNVVQHTKTRKTYQITTKYVKWLYIYIYNGVNRPNIHKIYQRYSLQGPP